MLVSFHVFYFRAQVSAKYYVLSNQVEKTGKVSSDWKFIEIRSAVAKVKTEYCSCSTSLLTGMIGGSGTVALSD